jgi:transcriptional regulator with XRE-family HTH domain
MTQPAVDPKVIEAEENLLIDFHFLLQEVMNEKGMTRSELAERAGLSKARLTQILGSEANPTIKSMARLFHALDEKVCLSRKPFDAEREGDGSQAPSAKETEWQWGNARSEDRKHDKELARIVKASFASNDNYASRVMFIDSEVALAPDPETTLRADAA